MSTSISKCRLLPTFEIRCDLSADLGIAAAVGDQHRERQQFSGRHVEPAYGVVVAEAVGRQQVLDVYLVGGSSGVPLIDQVGAEDLLLNGHAELGPGFGGGGRLPGQWQVHPAVGESDW